MPHFIPFLRHIKGFIPFENTLLTKYSESPSSLRFLLHKVCKPNGKVFFTFIDKNSFNENHFVCQKLVNFQHIIMLY